MLQVSSFRLRLTVKFAKVYAKHAKFFWYGELAFKGAKTQSFLDTMRITFANFAQALRLCG